jgi:peptidoglycan/LPS O-acetylase OafA/YrhL
VGGAAQGNRYDHIDALRALAALLVLWCHADGLFELDGSTELPAWIEPGRAGVILFFAISGFVIPFSLRGTPVDGTRNFVIRRFFRLYPAYWLSIPLGWLAIHWYRGETFAPLDIIANATMLQEFFGLRDAIGVYWTLAVELVFYAICLVFFCCGIAHRSMTYCGLTALTAFAAWFYARLSSYVFHVEHEPFLAPNHWYKIGHYLVADPANLWGDFRFVYLVFASVMGLGALMRFWHDRKAGTFDKVFIVTAVGSWSVWFLVVPIVDYIQGEMSMVDVCTYLSHSIPILGFFVLSCFWKIRLRLLSYLGLISYSLYLFHGTIIFSLEDFLRYHPLSVLQSAPRSLLVIVAMLLSIAAAAAVFTFIERPAIELARRLTSSPSRNLQMRHSLVTD